MESSLLWLKNDCLAYAQCREEVGRTRIGNLWLVEETKKTFLSLFIPLDRIQHHFNT